jgi:mRNA interferase RelE/StbE
MDRTVQIKILNFLYKRLLPSNNPRLFGKALTGKWTNYWSYRVGDYRILADIKESELVVLVIHVDHRRHVYA